jgi:alkylated DNA repair dioxygenase AlkB
MVSLNLFETNEPQELLPLGDSHARYFPAYIDDFEADKIFSELLNAGFWQQPDIQMFGKISKLPREVAWITERGQRYRYSGITSNPQPWNPVLKELCLRVSETSGVSFNSVLLNRYRDGKDSVSWHSDDEPELGTAPYIASLSLGAERRFQLRHKYSNETIEKRLAHGSLLLMSGNCQQDWLHRIPRESRINSPRINLTFRMLNSH